RHLEDYFVVARQAPTLLIVGTLVASYLSTQTFLTETAYAYRINGGGWILFPSLTLIGYVIGAVYFNRYLRRSQTLTVTQYFARRFNSRRVQVIAGLTVIFGIGGYLVAVTQGAAVMLDNLTPLNYTTGLVVAWIAYTSFTMYSGSKGVVITDTLMFLLFTFVSFLGVYAILQYFGGWNSVLEQLLQSERTAALMSWHGNVDGPEYEWASATDYLWWLIIISLAWGFVTAISPWQSSRFLMAKSEHVVFRSACIAAIAVTLIQIALYMAAVSVNIVAPDIQPREEVMIWASMELVSPWIGALILAGIVAAALSSATTFLSLVGFTVSNDIVRFGDKDERASLKLSRQMMLLVGALALVICFFIDQEIFWITYFAGTLFAAAWGPVAFMSVWSDRITEPAAFWGITTGFFGVVIPTALETFGPVVWPPYLHPIIIGSVLSLATVLVVSRYTSVSEGERSYRLSLLETPASEIGDREARRTERYALAFGVFGVAMTALAMIVYVVPYQAIVGPVADGGGFDWFSGEALHAYGWALVFVPAGWLMYREARKSYRRQH
ncbi:MAG: sodium:solute symporter family protein, partial [Woeseiaceae bacterium]|nr:sodium:solute symporter family protein [Woeseiaceae bacterium]